MRQLRPGTAVAIPADGHRRGEPAEHVYWDAYEVAARPPAAPNGHDLTDALEHLLADAVRRRMVADVPLGAFLSGGIDSSTVVALMQKQSARPVKTFSIGFNEERYNEAPYAKAVAEYLGTDHTELYVPPEAALELIPQLAEWYDEPFADASQIPTLLVSELARRHVTVALSGDGGDELFHGYPWYQFGARLGGVAGALPLAARRSLAFLLTVPSPAAWDLLARLAPGARRPERLGDRAHKLAAWISLPSQDLLFREIRSLWSEPEALVPGATEPVDPIWMGAAANAVPDFLDRMPMIDLLTYLPDDILTKVDRATMAVGLEGRCPILDHRVVEFALGLPREYKIAGGRTKILAQKCVGAASAAGIVRTAQTGVRIADSGLAARSPQGLGGGPARPGGNARRRFAEPSTDPAEMAGAPVGPPQLAIRPVERVDVPGMETPLGLIAATGVCEFGFRRFLQTGVYQGSALRILYSHRVQSHDGQGVHIEELVNAMR